MESKLILILKDVKVQFTYYKLVPKSSASCEADWLLTVYPTRARGRLTSPQIEHPECLKFL